MIRDQALVQHSQALFSIFCQNNIALLVVRVFVGAPIVMSQPHFYQGAKQYKDAVRGLHPEKELHETFVDVEPVSTSSMLLT